MGNNSHLRIDEGIKRPRYAHKPPAKRKDTATGTIPPDLDPDAVLDRYLTEATTSQIAASYGVSRKTLVRWLVNERPEAWKKVQVIRALCRKEDADEGIETACDALSLARAREQLRSGQWDLERLDSGNYGQKQQLELNVNDDLGERLRRARERVIEGVATTISSGKIVDASQQTPEDSA
jgi:hypothetical protein